MENGRDKRRLAAILAADIVGYSRLMEADESGTLAQLKAIRKELIDPKVEEYSGRIVKTTGDGILIEFPSVIDAVQMAVEVQRGVARRNEGVPEDRRLVFRVGINQGDIIVDGDDILGDGVNIAARLEQLSQPGGICISRLVRDQIRDKLSYKLDDLGEQKVKNISRPVRAFNVLFDETASSARAPAAPGKKPSVAVLPFENIGGGVDENYFGDGLAEDIITELAKFHEFDTVARNSSFQYRGGAADIRDVGRQLAAQYVVEGSFRRSNDRIRVTAQLIDATTGNHVWAERFDRDLIDIFDVQDELTTRIVGTLAGGWAGVLQTAARQAAKQKSPDRYQAYDLVLMARTASGVEDYERRKKLLRRALELDPDLPSANQAFAWLQLLGWIFRKEKSETPPDEFKRHALRAINDEPQSATAHRTAAFGYFFDKQLALFEREREIALRLAPNDPEIMAQLGMTTALKGDWQQGDALVSKAFEINQSSSAGFYHTAKFYQLYLAEMYHKAIDVIRLHPRQFLAETKIKYVMAYGQLGDRHAAREYWKQCTDAEEGWSYEYVKRLFLFWNVQEQDARRFLDGIAKAGFGPE